MGFDMAELDRMFFGPKWRCQTKEVPGGYEVMVQLHFSRGEIDRGRSVGRLKEIAILRALGLAITNGFAKCEKKK